MLMVKGNTQLLCQSKNNSDNFLIHLYNFITIQLVIIVISQMKGIEISGVSSNLPGFHQNAHGKLPIIVRN
jgi:hypothetical protein